jgi:tetratricopeptide (TPR) repeat protein
MRARRKAISCYDFRIEPDEFFDGVFHENACYFMKNVFVFILIFVFAGVAAAQKPKPIDERSELEAAVNAPLNADKAALLEKFVKGHPKSKLLQSANESLVIARAAYAEELLRSGNPRESYDLFAKAVNEAPEPIPDKLFDNAINKFPSVLYWAGQKRSAFDIARLIEKRSAGNSGRLQSMAMFYLSIEDGSQAKTLAEAAIAADPTSATAFETLGLANRINFDFEAAANAYLKAVELDNTNISAKLSLAAMQRALGKPAEATALYRTILEAKPDEATAASGLVMALFDEGKRDEAETQLALVTEKDDKNFVLLSSAAYWYAANGNGE